MYLRLRSNATPQLSDVQLVFTVDVHFRMLTKAQHDIPVG